MPSRNQKRSGIVFEVFAFVTAGALSSLLKGTWFCSDAYRSRKVRSVSGSHRRSKSTLLYRPNGPAIRQRVISPVARAAVSRSMFAPSEAAAKSANLKLKVQSLWIAAADFTRRSTALKAALLAACWRTRFDAKSCSSGAAGSAQIRIAESHTTSGRSRSEERRVGKEC